jgi:hypothetical protein
MRYVAGELLNFLELARAVTPSPALDTNFPAGRLYDGYADAVAAFGSNGADPKVTVDLAMVGADGIDNGNLDTWAAGAPAGWTVATSGSGAVTETTTAGEMRSGSAAKLKKGSGGASITKRYRVRAGQRLNLSVWLRVAASGIAKAQFYNPVTKRYLTSGAAWQAAQAYFATEAGTSYAEKTLSFQVEDLATCGDPITLLELLVRDDGAGGASDYAFVDDAFLWPSWNAVVVAGHNIEPGMAPTARSSTDGFSGVDTGEAVLTPGQPSFYGYLASPSARRYVRLAMAGTQASAAVWLGELVVTYLETGGEPDWGFEIRHDPDNVVAQVGLRTVATRGATQRRRVLRLSTGLRSAAEYLVKRDEVHRRCHGALWPLIVVPLDAEDVVLHGRLDDSWSAKRQFLASWSEDMIVSENPLPRVVPA